MKTAQEIAQWVIDNRYPKWENEKVSDFEMYQNLVGFINHLPVKSIDPCKVCDWAELPDNTAICKKCGTTSPF